MGNGLRADAAELAARLDRIRKLTEELRSKQNDARQQRSVAEKIRGEIDQAKKALKPLDR